MWIVVEGGGKWVEDPSTQTKEETKEETKGTEKGAETKGKK